LTSHRLDTLLRQAEEWVPVPTFYAVPDAGGDPRTAPPDPPLPASSTPRSGSGAPGRAPPAHWSSSRPSAPPAPRAPKRFCLPYVPQSRVPLSYFSPGVLSRGGFASTHKETIEPWLPTSRRVPDWRAESSSEASLWDCRFQRRSGRPLDRPGR